MNKYGAKKTTRKIGQNTYTFDSKAEADYFDLLYYRAASGEIRGLSLQPSFQIATAYKIDSNGKKKRVQAMRYTPDFKYKEKGKWVVVEVKGVKTEAYNIRKKLFLAQAKRQHNIDVFIEVVKGKETIYRCDTVNEVKDGVL